MFKKGDKKPEKSGKKKGSVNQRTQQWETFSEYCLNGGLKRFEQELNRLEGKDFVSAFTTLLEFLKPKLARAEMKHEGEISQKIKIEIIAPE